MDPLEVLIRAAHSELEALAGESIALALDNLEQAEHDAPPKVSWIEQGGEHLHGRGAGGSEADGAELLGAWSDIVVELWFVDVDTCRLRMHQALNAIRTAWKPGDYRIGRYRCPARTETRHGHAGKVFELEVSVRLPVALLDPGVTTVPVESHHGDIAVADGTADVSGSAPP